MARKKEETCGNCRFFVPEEAEVDVTEDAEGNRVIEEQVGGECHRHAPHCVISGRLMEDGVDTVWPWLSAEDWCGEWET